jgi:hypothetical protein
MLLRDRDAGTAHHRYGGSRWDAWASHLGEAPAPYTQAAITAAIRFYAVTLDEIIADWDPRLQLDNRPCSNCWTRSTGKAPRSNSPERANTRHPQCLYPAEGRSMVVSCPPT